MEFDEAKRQQLKNYCLQLKGGRLEYDKTFHDISHHQKQVWIITRGTPRSIKQIDDISIKEVPSKNS